MPKDLKTYLNEKKRPHFYNADSYVSHLKDCDTTALIARADRLVHGDFLYDEPWDMEQTNVPVHLDVPIDWHVVPSGDPEWMWMLNRQNYFVTLAEAYVLTKDTRYFDTLKTLWADWLSQESDPTGKTNTSWRLLDVGLRIKNWLRTLDLIGKAGVDALGDALAEKILSSILRQCDFLLSSYSANTLLSNWAVLAYHGVYLAGQLLAAAPEAALYRERALEILVQCVSLQVAPDGWQWEQSTMYHHEVLMCLSEVILIAQRAGEGALLPEALLDGAKRMLQVSLEMTPVDGMLVPTGDSDVESVVGLQHAVGAILGMPVTLPLERAEDSLYAVRFYGDGLPDVTLTPMPESQAVSSGHVVFRPNAKSFVHLKNGPIGSGHGHLDRLHVDVVVNGVPLFIDSGRYTYREDLPERQEYKAGAAHNTLLLDQHEFETQELSWGMSKVAQSFTAPAFLGQKCSWVSSSHLGYLPQAFANRQLIALKPNLLVVVDQLTASGTHSARQQFVLDEAIEATILGNAFLFAQAGGKQVAKLHVLGDAQKVVAKTRRSRHYNAQNDTTAVRITTEFADQALLPLVLDFSEGQKAEVQRVPVFDMQNEPLDANVVVGLSIRVSETESWDLVINGPEQSDGRKLQIVNGTGVYGRAVAIHRLNGQAEVTVLN